MASTAIKNRLNVARVVDVAAEIFRGSMQIFAAATVILLLVFVIDYQVWRLPLWVRLLAWAIVITTGVRVALKEMVGPLRESRSDDALALRVENKYKVLRGRLIATVQLTRHMDKWYKQGVALLVEAVKNQTEEMIKPFRFYKITDVQPIIRSSTTLGAIVLGIGMLSIWQSEELVVFCKRMAGAEIRYPSPYKAVDITPGWVEGQNPKRVIRGDSILFTIRFAGPHPPSAKLEMVTEYTEGNVKKTRVIPIEMEMLEDNKGPFYQTTVARVTEGFKYRFTAGRTGIDDALIDKDKLGKDFEIIALVRPVVTPNLTIQYPTYTGKNPLRVEGGNAEAITGSRISMTVGCTKKIQKISFIYMTGAKAGADAPKGEREIPMKVVGQTASLDLPPIAGSFRYTIQVTDTEGAKNFETVDNAAEPPPTYSIRALPDKRPRVGILDPKSENTVVREEAQYLVSAATDDDFGILNVSLYWRVQKQEEQAVSAEEWKVEPIYTCGAQTPPTALNKLVIPIMPKQKLAKPGDSIVFFIEARDHTAPTTVIPSGVSEKNLPEGIGRSKQYQLQVIDEETFKRLLAQQYGETIKALEEIRRQSETLSEKIGGTTTNIYTPKRLQDLFNQAKREEAQNNLARALNIYQTIEEKAPEGTLKKEAAQRIRVIETQLKDAQPK